MKETCLQCRFFNPAKPDEVLRGANPNCGNCHRRAPNDGWPLVWVDNWCGEFDGVSDAPPKAEVKP